MLKYMYENKQTQDMDTSPEFIPKRLVLMNQCIVGLALLLQMLTIWT